MKGQLVSARWLAGWLGKVLKRGLKRTVTDHAPKAQRHAPKTQQTQRNARTTTRTQDFRGGAEVLLGCVQIRLDGRKSQGIRGCIASRLEVAKDACDRHARGHGRPPTSASSEAERALGHMVGRFEVPLGRCCAVCCRRRPEVQHKTPFCGAKEQKLLFALLTSPVQAFARD